MKNLTRVLDWTLKALFLAVLVYFAVIKGPEKVEVVTAKRGLFEFRVTSNEGTIRSKSRYTVTAFADGSLRRLTQKIGDEVKQGSILTEILIGPNYESIRAAVGGVISKVHKAEGGKMERKDPILEISDPTHMEVLVELEPSEAARVHMGDPITISKWGSPEPLHGVVTKIGKPEKPESTPAPSPDESATTETAEAAEPSPAAAPAEPQKEVVQVVGELKDVPEDVFRTLGHRSRVDVSIQVANYPNALKLPVGAVFQTKKDWAVYKVVDGRALERKVTISNRNNEEVMIEHGLNEGDPVIHQPGPLVKDSVRVAEVK